MLKLYKIVRILLLVCIVQVLTGNYFAAFAGGGPAYTVSAFDASFCGTSFPTSYQTVSFSITENDVGCFKKSQTNATLVLTLPANFEFNTAAGTVTYTAGRDISNLSVSSFTTSAITVSITIPNAGGSDALDDISFNNFQIRATAGSSTGSLLRLAADEGTFKIDNSTSNPVEPMGTLDSQSPMVWDDANSTVYQQVTGGVDVTQGAVKQEVITIKIVTQNSCTPLIAEKFCFNTDGSNGTGSDNPSLNITKAQVWYSGSSSLFADAATLFGEISSPSGSFKINGNPAIELSMDTNYFWLTYDVPLSATNGELLDARLDSVLVSGSLKYGEGTNWADLNPVGSRTIIAPVEFYSIVDGNWTSGTTWSTTDGGASCSCTPTTAGQVYISNAVTVNSNSTVQGVVVRTGGVLQGTKQLDITNSLSVENTGYLSLGTPITVGGNLTLSGTGASTTTDEIDVAVDCDIGSGTSLTLNGGNPAGTKNLLVGGNLTVNGTLTLGSKSVVLDGGTSSIDGSGSISGGGAIEITAGDKSFSSSANISITSNIDIQGAYSVTNSGVVTLVGSVTGSSGSSVWTNGSNSTLNISGELLTTGTLTASASGNTINYNGTGAQIVKSGTYYHLNVLNGSTKTMGGNLTATGNLSIGASTTLAGSSYTLSLNGDWSCSGGFTAGTGKVIFIGSTSFTSSVTNVFNDFQIDNGATLTLNTGNSITVNGTLTNNGLFTLKCPSSASPSASLIDNGTIVGSGSFGVERYITSGRYWFMSPPIASCSSGDFDCDASDKRLYWYDESTNWVRISNNSTTLSQVGYIYKDVNSSKTIVFSGTVNTGSVTNSTTNTPAAPKPGWNLVGNPYPSAIDWDAASGWTKTNLMNIVWIYDGSVYSTYNGNTGIGTNGGTRYVPATQGFWVKDTLGGGQLGMNNAVRVHDVSTQIKSLTKQKALSNIIRLTTTNGTDSDETVIYFDGTATNDYEKMDTEKSFGIATIPHLYTKSSDGRSLTVNSLPSSDLSAEKTINIGFKVSVAGDYTITASNLESFDPTKYIYLEDLTDGVIVDLRSYPNYEFSSGAVNNDTRFRILLKDVPLPVEFLYLKARLLTSAVEIKWGTATEVNNAYFTLERSANGISFTEISEIRGAGNSNSVIEYSYMDNSPLSGTSYYRLKQTDFDGKAKFSGIVTVNFRGHDNSTCSIYPNPAKNKVFILIENSDGERYDVKLTDITGRPILLRNVHLTDTQNAKSLDLSDILPGIYTIEVKSESNCFTQRLVVEK